MIVIAAVMGECCTSPHLKTVEVPTSDETVAVRVAERFLEFGTDGWELGDAIALVNALFDCPDYTVPASEVPVWGLQAGDEIEWDDPDEGVCSRVLKVKSVEFRGDRSLAIEEEDGSVVEGYIEEFT